MTDTLEKCRFCNETYPNLQSSRQHERLAHPGEYNETCQPAIRTKARWSDEETYLLAREEARIYAEPCPPRFINQALYDRHVVARTLEGLKGHRRSAEYRALVAELRLRLERGAQDGFPPMLPPPTCVPAAGGALAYILEGDAETEAAVSVPACTDEGPVCNLERPSSTIPLF